MRDVYVTLHRRDGSDQLGADRHRLHRGGGRDANSALWRIALVRMHCHQPSKDYVARRTAEDRTRREILRCLKGYIAREAYPLLAAPGRERLVLGEPFRR